MLDGQKKKMSVSSKDKKLITINEFKLKFKGL